MRHIAPGGGRCQWQRLKCVGRASYGLVASSKQLPGRTPNTRAHLKACGVDAADIVVEHVAGSYEIPFAAQVLLETKRFDGVVCIGCLIKGETWDPIWELAGVQLQCLGGGANSSAWGPASSWGPLEDRIAPDPQG